MEIDAAIKNLLMENNPFTSNAAGDPRENMYPDVPGIDRAASRYIINVIAQKNKEPGIPRAAAVLGDTGSGKTHLIGRLIKAGCSEKTPFSFAYIRPFIDPNRAFRYLLKEIVNNLDSESIFENQFSQLQFLCGRIFTRVLEKVAKEKADPQMLARAMEYKVDPVKALGLNVKAGKRKVWFKFAKNFLQNKYSSLNSQFVHVLLQYFFYDQKRPAAVRWLKGKTIDREDCDLLEVRDRSGKKPAALEAEAHDILQSLDLILEKFGDRPLIVFFDQLENIRTDEHLKQFQNLVWRLSDETRAMMPIAFFRGRDWETYFRKKLDGPISSRFEGNLVVLEGCSIQQARQIVQCRLDMVLSNTKRPHPLYPFFPDYRKVFDETINSKIRMPRQVIGRANKMLMTILSQDQEELSVEEILTKAFKSRHEEILANYDQFEPDEGRLTLCLKLYLRNRPKSSPYFFNQLDSSNRQIRYIDLTGSLRVSGKTIKTAFLIDVELHHRAVGASLKRGIDFIRKNDSNRALYIRDMRCPLPAPPKWPGTNKLLEDLKKQGGKVIMLDKKTAAWWYALTLLKFDVTAGDVACGDGSGSITEKQLDAFIGEHLNGENYPAFALVDKYLQKDTTAGSEPIAPSPMPSPSPSVDFAEATVEILKQTPVNMLKAELVASKMSRKLSNDVSVEDLLLALKDYHDRFTFIRALDGTIIKLKLEWVYAQT